MNNRRILAYRVGAALSLSIVILAVSRVAIVRASSPTVANDYIYAQYAYNTLRNPTGLAMAGSILVISDTGNNVIRYFNTVSPGLTLLAGNGTAGYVDGTQQQAEFNKPTGLTARLISIPPPNGQPGAWTALGVTVADTGNGALRSICIPLGGNACGVVGFIGVKTVAGGNVSNNMTAPTHVNTMTTDPVGNFILNGVTSTSTPINGSTTKGYLNGSLSVALFNSPTMAIAAPQGTVVVDMGNNMIRLVQNQVVSTLSGQTQPGYANGAAGQAKFYKPTAIAYNSSDGYYYVSDTYNNCIRKIDGSGNTSTYAGTCTQAGLHDDTLSAAKFNKPTSLVINGTLMYVCDSGNNAIRRIDMSSGYVSTYID